MRIIHKGFIGVIIIFIIGCVKEVCIPKDKNNSLSIAFRYLIDPQGENLFKSSVNTISVLLFDTQGIYINTYKKTVASLAESDYIMDFPTSVVGEYNILVLGDTDEKHYTIGTESTDELIPDTSHISDLRISVKHDNNIISRKLGNFFISKTKTVLVDGIGHKTVIVDLVKYTKNIHLTINGLGHLSHFTPYFVSRNGIYKADNSISETASDIKYNPHKITIITKGIVGQHISQISTLRIMQDHKIPLIAEYDNGDKVDIIGEHELISLIKLSPKYKTQSDFDNESEFRIVLNYDNNVLVNIIINEWDHVIIKPEVS